MTKTTIDNTVTLRGNIIDFEQMARGRAIAADPDGFAGRCSIALRERVLDAAKIVRDTVGADRSLDLLGDVAVACASIIARERGTDGITALIQMIFDAAGGVAAMPPRGRA